MTEVTTRCKKNIMEALEITFEHQGSPELIKSILRTIDKHFKFVDMVIDPEATITEKFLIFEGIPYFPFVIEYNKIRIKAYFDPTGQFQVQFETGGIDQLLRIINSVNPPVNQNKEKIPRGNNIPPFLRIVK